MSASNPPKEAPENAELRETIKNYVESAYLHGLPTENLETGELEPPADIADTEWIADTLMEKVATAQRQAVEAFAEGLLEKKDTFWTDTCNDGNQYRVWAIPLAAIEAVLKDNAKS